MSARYAVFGNPIGHSRSPAIHARFARDTGQDLTYEAILAPLDGFAACVRAFAAAGGRGANVTVPFKEEAFRLCQDLTARARAAGAVNTLTFAGDTIRGDNTDGVGLLTDIEYNLGIPLRGRTILLLGAGGAARGVVGPLLAADPALLTIANRTPGKAADLAQRFVEAGPVFGCGYPDLAGESYEIVINATSASLDGSALPLASGLFGGCALAYDMMYGRGDTPFLALARAEGAARLADGLGMLVEQAAEAFAAWRGVRPQTGALRDELRRQIDAG